MPKPIIWNDKCYIDFQCELQVKSRFLLDLYAMGLNRIAYNFLGDKKSLGKVKSNGVLVCDKDRYFSIEEHIKNRFQDISYSSKFIKNMYGLLDDFNKLNYWFEDKLKNQNIKKEDVKLYIDELLDMMSLLCIQWLSFDIDIIKKVGDITDDEAYSLMSSLFVTPFQLRYQKAYISVLEDSSEENIERFILEYAFLNNFDIDKNEYEDKSKLTEIIKVEQKNLPKYKTDMEIYYEKKQRNDFERQILIEKCFMNCSEEKQKIFFNNLALLRACHDEEEERHYLQARALRNIRTFLEQNNKNIYLSIDEILGDNCYES